MSAQRSEAGQRAVVDIAEVVAGLAARIRGLAAELLPQGIIEGAEYRVGSVAGERGRSMAIRLYGERAGVWADFSSGETGDALDLVAAVLFRGDKKQAFRWALGWLGLDNSDPRRLAVTRRAVDQAKRRADQAGDEQAKRRGRAMRIYLEAQPNVLGTPVDDYLRGRGIDLRQLGRQPRALRFHPGLYEPETQQRFPAMVAAITCGGQHIATHRTWLERRPDGSVGKVGRLIDPKKSLGSFRGGCIPLWRGQSGKALKDAPPGDVAIISEGIEDGLTCAIAKPEYRVLCAVSLGAMTALIEHLPPAIATVILAAQHDTEPKALQARDAAIRALLDSGRQVRLAFSAIGKDLNDQLQATAPAADSAGMRVPF